MEKITNFLNEPKIVAIVGNVNSGKSNLIYYLIEKFKEDFQVSIYTYGLKKKISETKEIFSIKELEKIKDSVIILDEFFNILDLEDRKNRRSIEQSFRLLHHNNNILILSGLPENFKKFISAKLNIILYKQVTIEDFINGSSVKRNILNYSGDERGTAILHLDKKDVIIYDGEHYHKQIIPYLSKYDTKKDNKQILKKKCKKNVIKKCGKNKRTKKFINKHKHKLIYN